MLKLRAGRFESADSLGEFLASKAFLGALQQFAFSLFGALAFHRFAHDDLQRLQVGIVSDFLQRGVQQLQNFFIAAGLDEGTSLRQLLIDKLFAFADLSLFFSQRLSASAGRGLREI